MASLSAGDRAVGLTPRLPLLAPLEFKKSIENDSQSSDNINFLKVQWSSRQLPTVSAPCGTLIPTGLSSDMPKAAGSSVAEPGSQPRSLESWGHGLLRCIRGGVSSTAGLVRRHRHLGVQCGV